MVSHQFWYFGFGEISIGVFLLARTVPTLENSPNTCVSAMWWVSRSAREGCNAKTFTRGWTDYVHDHSRLESDWIQPAAEHQRGLAIF